MSLPTASALPLPRLPAPDGQHPLYLAPVHLAPNPVRRLLVANRGEIALRVIRTAHQLGIHTVAVYSDVDAQAPHVSAADEAVYLGSMAPPPHATPEEAQRHVNPYMDAQRLVHLAQQTRCDALHPGYGYLSENADFADLVASTPGLRFVGPRGEVMREMGDKSNSKRLLKRRMGEEKAPVVPGYEGEEQSDDTLVQQGRRVGFPLLIKASAGGGGRGMRIVRDEASLREEVLRARSEAQRSFGSPTLLLERYVEGGKHIEVQIFGDAHGHVVSLGERECSVQRRHQKVIEESPSASFEGEENAQRRRELHESARQIGALLGYEGAATIEYIYDPKRKEFFFLEINTRLQVEHPVSEMCFGLDFVSLQLYIAGGGDLTKLSEVVNAKSKGHAIECRLCSEEPGADFAPRTGTIRMHATPLTSLTGYRCDSGVHTGSVVSTFFDSMLAKLIVYAPTTRSDAVAKMQRMLQQSPLLGVACNTSFMSACLAHPSFGDGSYTTALIPDHLESLLGRTGALAQALFRETLPAEGQQGVGSLPASVVVPTLLLLRHVRRQLHPPRGGVAPGFRLNRCDLSMVPTENYVVSLPDAAGEWDVQAQYEPLGSDATGSAGSGGDSADALRVSLWLNRADETEKSTSQALSQRAKKRQQSGGGGAAPSSLVQARTASTARYYAGRTSRAETEGRSGDSDKWRFGASGPELVQVEARLLGADVQVVSSPPSAHAPATAGAATGAPSRWIVATVRVQLGGRTSTHVLATDETFDQHEQSAQTAWVWCPTIAGQVRVVRRNLRLWAGRLEATGQKGGAADDSAYVTPMPCRILQMLAKDGESVESGQPLLVMESMKTEVTLRAQRAGVLRCTLKQGDTIGEGQVLCSVEEPTSDE